MKIAGRRFDFFAPDRSLVLERGSGVLTMCALEQTGDRFGPPLDYFLAESTQACCACQATRWNSTTDAATIDWPLTTTRNGNT